MQERIITIYCLCDEFLKAHRDVDLPGTVMSTAEVMTTALVAADIFGGCFERSRAFLSAHGYIPHMLSKSRFNRRLHALPESLGQGLFHLLSLVAKQTNEPYYEVELYRLRGDALVKAAVASPSEAESCFHRAIEVARQQRAKSLELRAVMSLARLWQQQGKREEARQMLAEIYGWFTEGFDTADLKEAKVLLDELS